MLRTIAVLLGLMCCLPNPAAEARAATEALPRLAVADTGSRSNTVNIVFIGDSITEGGGQTAPPPAASTNWLRQHAPGVTVFFSNQGRSGHTTVDTLPRTATDFPAIEQAARQLASSHAGQLVFSVMLGTNDSAMDGPLGSPVSPDDYRKNLATIVDRLLTDYPGSLVVIHRPIWYSPNTYNGSRYLAAGLSRLQSYFPEIDSLVAQYAHTHPGQVQRGDIKAFAFFKKNHLTYLRPEQGQQGTFYLHPNEKGAQILGGFWGAAIRAALKHSSMPTSEGK